MPSAGAPPGARQIIPDYAVPDAVCVPYWRFDIRATLEAFADAASAKVGVILVTPDPGAAAEYAAKGTHPDHLAIIAGIFNSPWLRDHAPISCREGGRTVLVRPRRHPQKDRPRDPKLFAEILAEAQEITHHSLPAGNLVSGPDGVALSTFEILSENGLDAPGDLSETGHRLGISNWVFVPAFQDDKCGHADTMVRFLGPGLVAYADRDDDGAAVSQALADALATHLPGVECLPLPARAGADGFDSPLNWVQIGRTLFVPDYPQADDTRIWTMLARHGFDPVPIPTATAGLGGGLHCLTASIFAD